MADKAALNKGHNQTIHLQPPPVNQPLNSFKNHESVSKYSNN